MKLTGIKDCVLTIIQHCSLPTLLVSTKFLDCSHTGIVDTYPIYVSQPRSHKIAKLLFNPKYGSCVVKFIMAIDFLGLGVICQYYTYQQGRIIFWDGPFLGLTYDGHIWLATSRLHPFLPDELFMGGISYDNFL